MKPARQISIAACVSIVALDCRALGQVTDVLDGSVAGIPVNYTEAKVGEDALPDPLLLANGRKVTDAKTWNEERV